MERQKDGSEEHKQNLSYVYVRKQVEIYLKCWVAEVRLYKYFLKKPPMLPTVWNRYLFY